MADRTPSPAEEARHLHACLFRGPLDDVVISRYEAALEAGQDGTCPASVARVVARRLDAEAVEFALRRRGRGGELARRMQILCYLVEVRPEYLSLFVNLDDATPYPSASPLKTQPLVWWSRRFRLRFRHNSHILVKWGKTRPHAGAADGTVCPTSDSEGSSDNTTGPGSARTAWAALLTATLRSGWKWLKGEYLVRRHGLV